jgi:multiple sugar transport system substrate-binding protein
MAQPLTPPPGGLSLPITRRGLMHASAILAGAGLISASPRPLWAAETFDELKPQWTAAGIDWTAAKGTSIVLGAEQHPWTDAITPLVPLFTRLTGIEVRVQTQSETEYTAQLPVKLGAGAMTPDVYMVWAIGQAITAASTRTSILPIGNGGTRRTSSPPHGRFRNGRMASATSCRSRRKARFCSPTGPCSMPKG